ncbi:MAG: adenylate kinase, partial [Candidatus Doudnabacteria bacterium Gr01-1014_77]
MYNNYNMNTSTYIFIGPQGSGKGTQAEFLVKKLNAEFVEMGGLLREISSQDSEFGKHVKGLIDNGVLLTDDDIEKVLTEKLSQIDRTKTVVFDGVPRRIGQANFLLKALDAVGRKDLVTIYISLPREETFHRLSLRRVCEVCTTPAI